MPKPEAIEAYDNCGDDPFKDPKTMHELMKFRLANSVRDGIQVDQSTRSGKIEKGLSAQGYEKLKIKLTKKLKPLVPMSGNQLEHRIDEIDKRLSEPKMTKRLTRDFRV